MLNILIKKKININFFEKYEKLKIFFFFHKKFLKIFNVQNGEIYFEILLGCTYESLGFKMLKYRTYFFIVVKRYLRLRLGV